MVFFAFFIKFQDSEGKLVLISSSRVNHYV